MATDPAVQAANAALSAYTSDGTAAHRLQLAQIAVAAVTPLIRAQAFTEAADKLEASGGIIGCARAIDPILIDLQVVAHNPVQGEAMHKVIGYTAARYCAGLVRGLGEETENA